MISIFGYQALYPEELIGNLLSLMWYLPSLANGGSPFGSPLERPVEIGRFRRS